MVLVAYAGDVKPDTLHGKSTKLEIPYFRSKHEDILKLRKTIRQNPRSVYKTILQTKPYSTVCERIQIANAQFRERTAQNLVVKRTSYSKFNIANEIS